MEDYLELGQIANIFGIKGMIKVKPFTEDIEQFYDFEKIYIKNRTNIKEYLIEEVKYHKNMILLKLKGIDTPEQGELLKNSIIIMKRCDLKPLEEGKYYYVDIIGLEVYTDENILLGKLEDIYNTGSNDIYVVKNELGKQILLPGTKEVIKQISLENKKITVHLIPGLENL